MNSAEPVGVVFIAEPLTETTLVFPCDSDRCQGPVGMAQVGREADPPVDMRSDRTINVHGNSHSPRAYTRHSRGRGRCDVLGDADGI